MSVVKRRIPHEVKAYKSTMFFGLTTRQLICAAIAVALAAPTVYLNSTVFHLDSDVFGYLIMFETIPPAVCGWMSYNDMPVEQIAVKIFYFYFGARRRKWQYVTEEAKIREALVKIEYEETAEARRNELKEEKQRKKEEKKQQKAAAKESRKNARTVRRNNGN